MGTRPQTLYGLADSPVGLAAFMLDHDAYSYEQISHAFDGHPAGELTRDEILDNITLYWLTSTAISASRLYWENNFTPADVNRHGFNAVNVSIPAAVGVFPGELYQAPRSWAEKAYHNLFYFNEVDKGGHFAA